MRTIDLFLRYCCLETYYIRKLRKYCISVLRMLVMMSICMHNLAMHIMIGKSLCWRASEKNTIDVADSKKRLSCYA
jgi:hypothetical protein